MTYAVPADFRTGTLASFAQGCSLDATLYPDAAVTAVIAAKTLRLDALTTDHFEPTNAATILVHSANGTRLLLMPKRVRNVTLVETRGLTGTYYTQLAATYTFVPFTGDWTQLKTPDVLEIVPGQWLALTGAPAVGGNWPAGDRWPIGVGSVRVTGDFDWPAVPWQAQRALALMVWDHFQQFNPDLRRASRMTTNDMVVDITPQDPDHPTGIWEADELIRLLRRDWSPLIA